MSHLGLVAPTDSPNEAVCIVSAGAGGTRTDSDLPTAGGDGGTGVGDPGGPAVRVRPSASPAGLRLPRGQVADKGYLVFVAEVLRQRSG